MYVSAWLNAPLLFRTVEMVTAETKIFSVAVQQGKSDTSSGRPVVLRDVEGQMVDRPVILNRRKLEDNSDSEFQPVLRDNEPAPAPSPAVREREAENKKSKKNKKKNKTCEQPSVGSSSAEESKDVVEVETSKSKKKKTKKEKTPEPEVSSGGSGGGQCEEIFEEFVKEDITYPEDFSPDKDLVEFSEEEKIVEIDDNEDSEKVEFFIREKSSSVESDNLIEGSVRIDGSSAKPNPWFNNFLQKSSSMIEDQIFGAAKKYEDQEDRQDEDEEMLELEKNQTNVETNIAALLEDDEDNETGRVSVEDGGVKLFLQFSNFQETQSGRLPVILKVEPKQPVEPYSRYNDHQSVSQSVSPSRRIFCLQR